MTVEIGLGASCDNDVHVSSETGFLWNGCELSW